MIALALLALASLAQDPATREPGLTSRWYFVGEPMGQVLDLVPGQTPNVSTLIQKIDFDSRRDGARIGDFEDTYLQHVFGYVRVPSKGAWTFRLTSDDGSKLWIDGRLVIDHDGLHSALPKTGSVELDAGDHEISVWYFDEYWDATLRLEWAAPGTQAFEVVPASAFTTHAGVVRVTAPGAKKVMRPLKKGRPGDGMPLEEVHPSLELFTCRPESFQPRVGGLAWRPNGNLLVSTWDPIGAVWELTNTAGSDRSKIEVRRFAAGLAEPLGLSVVGERVFVLQKHELTELVDKDGDGVCDEYKALCSAWDVSSNFHEFAFGLVHKDGWLYFNLAIAIDPGGRSTRPQVPGRGSVIRVRIADGAHEVVAHGLRTPNGIGLGPDGEIFLTDNQGDWLPCSKLLHLDKGDFFGSRAVLSEKAASLPVKAPVLWLPQNEIGNSPGNPALIPSSWGPYSGQLVHCDVTHGGVKRDFLEKVDGAWQGAVFRWTQGLEAGINRIAFGPDGALYVGGIGSTGNWGQEGKLGHGLQRLKYTAQSTFEMLALRARSNGFEVELTEPLAPGVGWDVLNWNVQQWRYVPTEEYGGPKVDEETLVVKSASVAADRKRVFLQIEGLKPAHVVYLHVVGPIENERGQRLWSTEAWYTLNAIPKDLAGTVIAAPKVAQNVLTDDEARAGWRLLFDGASTKGWRGYKKPAAPASWKVEDGELVLAQGGAGDLVTEEEFGDFELTLDWKITKGGNSGVFYRADEDHTYVWESAPEMQVLDNDEHPDGRNPMTSAGSNYALQAPPFDPTAPVGMWNRARIVAKGAHVEHWLNGVKCAEYEQGSEAWKALVASSKFASMKGYGKNLSGRIALQDHGDRVAFRNVKIRVP